MSSDDSKAALYRYRFGAAEFDEARFELRVAGLPVEVQRKPLEVLSVLLAHAGEVVTKEELLDTVWQGRPTVDNVVANAVAKLRGALGPDAADRIVTQPRVGYRFDGPLARTAVGRSLASAFDLEAGMAVPGRPNFVLESQLGGAGRSEVWTARHGKMGELRVYKFALHGERLAALKREATLYRVLRDNLGERADIARVLDWNFESPPYFLECAHAGPDLAAWCEAGPGLAALPLAERLDLFLEIADAVAAAHGVGVLHKDLKPTNVLVAAKPAGGWQPCLSDFGSGRLLESERLGAITGLGLTVTGALSDAGSGTLQYLAPEVLAGQPPTVQSDLYALGIMLYQFVVGDLKKPMVSGWERDVDDVLLREDLAAATDGDPARRLAGVPALIERLRTLEARRADRARADAASRAARAASQAMQRSRARRPWVLAAMVALAAGLAASLWLYRQAHVAGQRVEAMNEFLYSDVLANTGALKTDDDPDPGMRRVLNNAAVMAGERFARDPGSEGWIRYGIGQGLSGLGDYAAAEQQQRLAVALLTKAHGPGGERTLLASRGLVMLLLEQSKFDQAEAVLAAVDMVAGGGSDPDSVFVMRALRGMLLAARKDCTGALIDLRSADAIELAPSPESAYNRFNVRSWIGETLNCLGRHADALVHYQSLLDAEPDAEILGPALIAYARLGHATALLHAGAAAAAEAELRSALALLESGVGDADPFTMGQALVVAGRFYADAGDLETAVGYLERGRSLLLTVDERQEKALSALRLLGTIDVCNGELARATERLAMAHAAFAESYGAGSPDAQGAGFWLAAALLSAGDPGSAYALAAELDPAALRVSLGGDGWAGRLEALRDRATGEGDMGGPPPALPCPAALTGILHLLSGEAAS
ncbi:MAG: winged helix-turn-helix domain-containing protein [Pseudomonadales bacterium]